MSFCAHERSRSLPERFGSTSRTYVKVSDLATSRPFEFCSLSLPNRFATRAAKSGDAWPAPIHSTSHCIYVPSGLDGASSRA